MNPMSMFSKIISILLIASIVFLNIYSFRDVYVGDFTRGRVIYYPPPFKTNTRVHVYNIVENSVETIEFNGLLISFNREISRDEVISIKSSGLDIYVLIISIIVLVIYFKITRFLIAKTHTYILNTILLFILVASVYVYVYVTSTPLIYGNVVELSESIECRNLSILLNVCLIDSFNTNSVIYLKTNGDVLVEIFKEESVIDRSLVKSNEDFLKLIETRTEYRLVVMSPLRYINITYRRVSFTDTRDYLSTLFVTYTPLLISFVTIVINRLKYIQSTQFVK